MGDNLARSRTRITALENDVDRAQVDETHWRRKWSEAMAENADLRDWRVDVTAALQNEGGTLYEDVPKLINVLRKERDALVKEAEESLKWFAEKGCVTIAKDGNAVQRLGGTAEIIRSKAADRIAALEDEGSKLNAEVGHMQEQKIKLREQRDTAQARLEEAREHRDQEQATVDRLRMLLSRLGEHHMSCHAREENGAGECGCGFSDAIVGASKPPEPDKKYVRVAVEAMEEMADRLTEACELYDQEHAEVKRLRMEVNAAYEKGALHYLEKHGGLVFGDQVDGMKRRLALADALIEMVEKETRTCGVWDKEVGGCKDGYPSACLSNENVCKALHAYLENKQPHVVNNPPLIGPPGQVAEVSDVKVDGKTLEEVRVSCVHKYSAWSMVDGRPKRVCLRCGHSQIEMPNEDAVALGQVKPEIELYGITRKAQAEREAQHRLDVPMESTPGASEQLPCGSVQCVEIPIKFESGTWPVCCNVEMRCTEDTPCLRVFVCDKCGRKIESKVVDKPSEPCFPCQGTGVILLRHGSSGPCDACNGTGRVLKGTFTEDEVDARVEDGEHDETE